MKLLSPILILVLLRATTAPDAQTGQHPPPPTGPANGPREAIVEQTQPKLTKCDLDFPGATPKELTGSIERSLGKPLNAIIPEEEAQVMVPPLRLTKVDLKYWQGLPVRTIAAEWGRFGPITAVVFLVAVLSTLLYCRSGEHDHSAKPRTSSIPFVLSRPLHPGLIVATQPGRTPKVPATGPGPTIIVADTAKPTYNNLTDNQLLGLLSGKPIALVRRDPQEVELVFVNPAHRHGFPVQ